MSEYTTYLSDNPEDTENYYKLAPVELRCSDANLRRELLVVCTRAAMREPGHLTEAESVFFVKTIKEFERRALILWPASTTDQSTWQNTQERMWFSSKTRFAGTFLDLHAVMRSVPPCTPQNSVNLNTYMMRSVEKAKRQREEADRLLLLGDGVAPKRLFIGSP